MMNVKNLGNARHGATFLAIDEIVPSEYFPPDLPKIVDL